jgi:alpha-D-xyloside xylohydrolase
MRSAMRNNRFEPLTVENADARMLVTAVTPQIIRLQIAPRDSDYAPNGPLLGEQAWEPVPAIVAEEGDSLDFATVSVRARINRGTMSVDFYDADGRLVQRGEPPTWDPDGVRMTRHLAPREGIYGFGLQFKSFQQRGKTRFLRVSSDPALDNGQTHVPEPYFLSTDGYGFFFNTSAQVRFDVGATDPERLVFQSPERTLDVFFLYGPSPREVVARYLTVVGPTPLPPRWGLGFWFRGNTKWNAEKFLAVAEEFRSRRIPCDVLGLEPGWQTATYPCSYVWNRENFPEPESFAERLHELGFRLNLWTHAWVHPSLSPISDAIKSLSADKGGMGGFAPDFTLADARDTFLSAQEPLVENGVDAFKLDEADGNDCHGGNYAPERNWFFPDDARFPSGLSGGEMHNLFGFLYQKAMHALFARRNRRTYLLSRANFAGGQREVSACYTDLYDFREFVRVTVNAGFGGQLWTPEVRGGRNRKEFVRRCQVMLMSACAQMNNWASGQLPWEFDEETEAVFRKYADLRMRLLPYFDAAFRRQAEEGLPVVRPLLLDFPDDPRTREIDDAYMLGDRLLIAPVIEGTSRTVYFPDDPAVRWVDFHTDTLYESGTEVVYKASLDILPMFVPTGTILPLEPVRQYATEAVAPETALRLYAGGSSEIFLYADDGETLEYRTGAFSKRRVDYREVKKGGWRLYLYPEEGTYAGQPEVRTFIVERHLSKSPEALTVDGVPQTFDYDAAARRLTLTVPDVRAQDKVVIRADE